MEDKIEVGEYVRTEFGNIGKFYRPASENPDVYYIYIDKGGNKYTSRYDSIVKHSKNIIDLIEEGDYVNGNIVYEVLDDEIELLSGKIRKKRIHFITGHLIDENEIKVIVTKEMFASAEYRVETD